MSTSHSSALPALVIHDGYEFVQRFSTVHWHSFIRICALAPLNHSIPSCLAILSKLGSHLNALSNTLLLAHCSSL
eukprot:3176521-Rhodomonas_salina.1